MGTPSRGNPRQIKTNLSREPPQYPLEVALESIWCCLIAAVSRRSTCDERRSCAVSKRYSIKDCVCVVGCMCCQKVIFGFDHNHMWSDGFDAHASPLLYETQTRVRNTNYGSLIEEQQCKLATLQLCEVSNLHICQLTH